MTDKPDDTRPFPIQAGESYRGPDGKMVYPPPSRIQWWLAEVAYKYYAEQFGDDQSLERLTERGGFGREELVMLIRSEKP